MTDPSDAPDARRVTSIATDVSSVTLRPWVAADVPALVSQANNRAVWRNLLDGFPHPYTQADAESWISFANQPPPTTHLCIAVAGLAAGGIGIIAGAGNERRTGHFGYWLGQAHWGKGIATAAAKAMLVHAKANLPFVRLQAPVFAWNPASMRVLEKAGFAREGTLRKSIFKDGDVVDSVMFAWVDTAA